jgi:hypothetical protein
MAFDGVSAIETRVAEPTVREAEPVIVPSVALIVAVPGAMPVAVNSDPPPLPTVAMLVFPDTHLQIEVMSWVVESLNSPVAV